MPYIPHTQAELQEMLSVVGVKTLDGLFNDIAPDMRPKSFALPQGKDEEETRAYFERLAAQNNSSLVSFLGAGYYAHNIPSAVDALSSQSAFYTAYTPYQAECSQGTLQAIFEFQTAIARLMDLDFANASVYDGGSALFEASTMCCRVSKRHKVVIDEAVNPIWRSMLQTYTHNQPIEIVTIAHRAGESNINALKDAVTDEVACVIVQNPNFFGVVNDFTDLFNYAKSHKVFSVLSVYPVLQSVLKTPGEMGADVAVGEGQSLGMPLSFGGPYLGLMACRKAMVRQFPGRLVGRTMDTRGHTGYVLTLQAREQHIRRAKATSNICSNQNLCALRSLIYLSLLGPVGLMQVAEHSMSLARYTVERLTALPGVERLNAAPFGNEVAFKLPVSAADVVDEFLNLHNCVPGYPLGRDYPGMENVLLVACTEKNSREQIGCLADRLGGML